MKNYFDLSVIRTAEELKKAYRRQCIALHPDKGGDEEEFKAMQAEYIRAAQMLGLDTKETRKPIDEFEEWIKNIKNVTDGQNLRAGDRVRCFSLTDKVENYAEALTWFARYAAKEADSLAEAVKGAAGFGEIEAVVTMSDAECEAFDWLNDVPAGAGKGGIKTVGENHYITLLTAIVTPSRVFYIDAEGHDYARCFLAADAFELSGDFLRAWAMVEAEIKAEEEAKQKAEAERKAREDAEINKWRDLLETLEELPARDWRDAASCKAYRKAEAHNKTVLKRNIKTILGHYFPNVKFTISDTSKTWCEHSEISWTDGPTVEEVESVAEIYRFIAEYYESDPYADYGSYKSVSDWQEWRALFGSWSDDRIKMTRELSDEAKEQAARIMAEYLPEFDGKRDDEDVYIDHASVQRVCVLFGVASDWSNYATMTEEERTAANEFDAKHRDASREIESYFNGYCFTNTTNRASVLRCFAKYMPIAKEATKDEATTEDHGATDADHMTKEEAARVILEAEKAGKIERYEMRSAIGWDLRFSGRGTYAIKKALKVVGFWAKEAKAWAIYEYFAPLFALDEQTEPTTEETTTEQDNTTEQPTAETSQAYEGGETSQPAEEADPLADELAEALRKVEEIRARMAQRDAERKAEQERKEREAIKAAAIAAAREEMERAEAEKAAAVNEWREAEKACSDAAARLSAAGERRKAAFDAAEAAAAHLEELTKDDTTDEQPATPSDLEGVDEFADLASKLNTADTLRDFVQSMAKEADQCEDWNDIYGICRAHVKAAEFCDTKNKGLASALFIEIDRLEALHHEAGHLTEEVRQQRHHLADNIAEYCRMCMSAELLAILYPHGGTITRAQWMIDEENKKKAAA